MYFDCVSGFGDLAAEFGGVEFSCIVRKVNAALCPMARGDVRVGSVADVVRTLGFLVSYGGFGITKRPICARVKLYHPLNVSLTIPVSRSYKIRELYSGC